MPDADVRSGAALTCSGHDARLRLGGQRSLAAVTEVVDDLPRRRPQGVLLLWIEDVEHQLSYVPNVAGCGTFEVGQPLAGQDGIGEATVGWVGFAAHESATLQPADQMREPG